MSEAPLVTVLMPVWNGGRHLAASVDSILAQSMPRFELLIVDDGSTDGAVDPIAARRDPRITILRNDTNVGLTRSLNRGLAAARAPLVARQDADDVSYPGRLAAQMAFMNAHPDVAVLGTQARVIDDNGRSVRGTLWRKNTGPLALRWQVLFDSPFVHTSVMFRREEIWTRLGGYDTDFPTSQDFELWSRVARAHAGMANLPDALVDFRVHTGSTSARYQAPDVAKLDPVLRGVLVSELGPDAVPAGWPRVWIETNNPRVCTGVADPSRQAAAALLAIHTRFLEVHREAVDDREIRLHLAALLLRVASAGAGQGSLASLVPLASAWRWSPRLSASMLPRYVGQLTAGLFS